MKLRLLPIGLLFAACAFAGAPGVTPAPWTPKQPAAPAGRQPAMIIDGVPDTGQFLPDTAWMVRVNDRVTTAGEFNDRYFSSFPEDRPAPDSLGRVKFLNSIINRDVLGLTARGLGMTFDFTERATMRETEERALSDVYFKRMVYDSVNVPESEVEEAVRQLGVQAHFHHLVFDTKPEAEKARRDLLAGKVSWHALALKQGEAKGDTGPDGDLGWLERSRISMERAVPMFRIGVGGTTEVFRTDLGYEIARMAEMKQVARPSVEVLRNVVRKNMRNYYLGLRADRIQGEIARRVGMVFDTATVNFVASHMKASMGVTQGARGNTVEINAAPPEIADEDTSRALATWEKGGRFTVGAFVHWYMSMNPLVRPNVNFPDAVVGQVSSVVLEPYRAQLAREMGLDKDPVVVSIIEKKREEMLVDRMYQDSVASKVWVSRDDRLAWYKAHLKDYFTFPAVDYAAIYRYHRAGADSLAAALNAGAKAVDVIAADSARGEVTGALHHELDSEHGAYHKVLFEELRPGKATVVGPDKDGIWLVLQLVAYDPGHQLSFEESQGMIDESLQNVSAEKFLNAMLDRLRKRYTIAWRPEKVMMVRLLEKDR